MIIDKKIHVFLAVVEAGNFSSAGRQLSLSQSVVSFHMDSLEKELGIQLFKRHGRTISITNEGEFFYDRAKLIARDAINLENSFEIHSSKRSKMINLAGNATTCTYVIPPMLTKFRDENNGIRFSYKFMNQDDIVEKLLTEELDLAFVGHPIRHRKLESRDCYNDKIVLVSAKDALPKKISAKDICSQTILWLKHDRGLEFLLAKNLTDAGIPPRNLDIFMELENISILKNFVRAGAGIAFLPEITVKKEIRLDMMQQVEVDDLELYRQTYMIFRKEKHPRDIVTSFLDFVNREFG